MRFWLLLMLVVCVSGFLVSSGTVSVNAGAVRLNADAVAHSLPVLVALAAPMVFMAFGLMLTMLFGRDGRRRPNRI
jgi:hypothetical protein